MGPLNTQQICSAFNGCFQQDAYMPTLMMRAGDEPLYLPLVAGAAHAYVFYARDLAQSCLHEAAHWLYAGKDRRLLTDYGYWYEPDGRNKEAQMAFEQHEVAVQAREWLLSLAACTHFRVSADNLSDPRPSYEFCQAIVDETRSLLSRTWSRRLHIFVEALCQRSGRVAEALHDPELVKIEMLLNEPLAI